MGQNIEFSPEQDAAIDACSMARDRVRARQAARTHGTPLPPWASPEISDEEAALLYFDGKNGDGDPLTPDEAATHARLVADVLDLFMDLSDEDIEELARRPVFLLLALFGSDAES